MAEASAIPIIETAIEEWRMIPGFEGDYEVSNHGRVRRLNFNNRHGRKPYLVPLVLKQFLDPRTKYWQIRLSRDGVKKFHGATHTLVLLAFIGPRPHGHQTAHLDGDGGNPVLSNLAYVTPQENEAHKRIHGRAARAEGPDCGAAKLTAEQVREMRDLRLRFVRALPFRTLGQMFGVSEWTAQRICSGKGYRNI